MTHYCCTAYNYYFLTVPLHPYYRTLTYYTILHYSLDCKQDYMHFAAPAALVCCLMLYGVDKQEDYNV